MKHAIDTPRYTNSLVTRVHNIVSQHYDISPDAVEQCIVEGLFQAAMDIKQRRMAELEYLGTFEIRESKNNQFIRYVASDFLLRFREPDDIGVLGETA